MDEPSSSSVGHIIGGLIIGILLIGVIVLIPIYYKFKQVRDRRLTVTLEKKINNVIDPSQEGNMAISKSHKFGFGYHIIRPRTIIYSLYYIVFFLDQELLYYI